MTFDEKAEAILDAYPGVELRIKKDGSMYRASAHFIDLVSCSTPCRPTFAEAIEALYDELAEMAWKKYRPVERLLIDLRVEDFVPVRMRRASDEGSGAR